MAETKKSNPPKDFSFEQCSGKERMKYEIAMELGLYDKVLNEGWKSLSAKETGRIGGILSKRVREEQDEKGGA